MRSLGTIVVGLALAAASVAAVSLRATADAQQPLGYAMPIGLAGPRMRSMPPCRKVLPVPGHRPITVRVEKEVRCFWMTICGEEYSFRMFDRRVRAVRPDGTCDPGEVVGEYRVNYDPAPVEPAQSRVANVRFPFPLILNVWSKTAGPEQLEVAFNNPHLRRMFLEQLTPERLLIAMQPAMRQLMPACASVELMARVSFDTGREFVRQWLVQAFRGLATQSPPRQFCAPTGATYPDGQPKIICDNGWEAPIDLRTILQYTYWNAEPTPLDRDLRACAQSLQVPQYVRGLQGVSTREMLEFEGTGLDFFGPFMSGNFRQAERVARRFIPPESSGYLWDLMMILSVFETMAIKDCRSASDREVFSFSVADPRIKRSLEEASKNPQSTALVFPFPLDVFGGEVRTGAECPPAVVYLGQPGFDGPGGPAQPLLATATGGVTSAGAANPYAAAMGATVQTAPVMVPAGMMRFREAMDAEDEGTSASSEQEDGESPAASASTESNSESTSESESSSEAGASDLLSAADSASGAASKESSAESTTATSAASEADKDVLPSSDASSSSEASSDAHRFTQTQSGSQSGSQSGQVPLPAGYGYQYGAGISGAYGAPAYFGTAAYPSQVGFGAYGHGYSTAVTPGYSATTQGTAAVGAPGQPGMTLVMPQTNIPIRVDSNGYASVPPVACANIVRLAPGRRSVCAMRSEGAQPSGTERGEAITAPRGEFRFVPFTMFRVLDPRVASAPPGPEAVPGAGPLQVFQLVEATEPPAYIFNVLRMSDSGEPSLWTYPQMISAPRLA